MPLSRRSLLKGALSSLGGFASLPVFSLYAHEVDAQSSALGNTLKGHAAASNLAVGSAVRTAQLKSDSSFRTLISQQANILVAEWEMKWNAMRPSPNQFNFAASDWLLDFAKQNNQMFRGHNLCWYQALPTWFAGYANTSNARALLSQHIRTVMGRYSGQMHSWDVVNEGINVADGRADGLRITPWLSLAGSDYIDYAFRVAREADPKALLTYNEFGVELDTPDNVVKRGLLLQLVKGMKSRGVPIDAVGLQSHLGAGPAQFGSGVLGLVRDLAALDVQVFITEMDVSDANINGSITYRDSIVSSVYANYLDMLLPEPNVTALLTWECRDPDSWLQVYSPRADGLPLRPLPFDANYQPKAAFTAICQAIDSKK